MGMVFAFLFSNTSLNSWYWKGISCGHGSTFGEEEHKSWMHLFLWQPSHEIVICNWKCNIFLSIISIAKCLHNGPSYNSFITIYAFVIVKHHRSLLSWLNMYNSPLFNVKGFIHLTNHYFCCIDNVPLIYLVFKNSFTSFNYLGSV
jgi:hypothetical protein